MLLGRRKGTALSNRGAVLVQNPGNGQESDGDESKHTGGPSDTHGSIPGSAQHLLVWEKVKRLVVGIGRRRKKYEKRGRGGRNGDKTMDVHLNGK